MKIFPKESQCTGLADKITASTSITYASPVSLNEDFVWGPDIEARKSPINIPDSVKEMLSTAAIDNNDLYPLDSILVSTSWNKNDDVFDPREVWAARHTPEDKPFNLDHDENQIIGHITENYPVSDIQTRSRISDDTDVNDLPTL